MYVYYFVTFLKPPESKESDRDLVSHTSNLETHADGTNMSKI